MPLLRGAQTLLGAAWESPPAWAWVAALAMTLALAVAFERFYDAPIRAWLRRRRPESGQT